MKYYSIDTETTGLDPEVDQVLEVGVVEDDLANQRPLEELRTWHCYVAHPRITGDPVALAMNALVIARVGKREPGYTYLAPEEVGPRLAAWLPAGDKPVAAGKNFGSFDLQFLRRLPRFPKFRHRSLDPAHYFRGSGKAPPSLEECCEALGMGRKVTHTALGDAALVVEVLRAGWNRLFGGPASAEVPLGRYLHYRGAYYDVLGVTPEHLVVYKAAETRALHTRALEDFCGAVEVDGTSTPKFKLVGRWS